MQSGWQTSEFWVMCGGAITAAFMAWQTDDTLAKIGATGAAIAVIGFYIYSRIRVKEAIIQHDAEVVKSQNAMQSSKADSEAKIESAKAIGDSAMKTFLPLLLFAFLLLPSFAFAQAPTPPRIVPAEIKGKVNTIITISANVKGDCTFRWSGGDFAADQIKPNGKTLSITTGKTGVYALWCIGWDEKVVDEIKLTVDSDSPVIPPTPPVNVIESIQTDVAKILSRLDQLTARVSKLEGGTPPSPTEKAAHISFVGANAETAAIVNDPILRNTFAAHGVKVHVLSAHDPLIESTGLSKITNSMGVPVAILQAPGGKILSAAKMTTLAEMKSFLFNNNIK